MKSFKHAFLIGAYKNPEYLKMLVDSLRRERSNIYIHINPLYINDFKDLISFYDAVDDVTTISTQKVRWGGVTFLNSIMDLMGVALKNKDNGYFHLLTGQDILIKPLSKLYQFFDTHYGEEFIDCGKDLIEQKEKSYLTGLNRSQYYHLFDFLNYRNNKVHRQLEKYFVKAQMALQIKRKWPFPNYYNGLGWFSFTRGAVEEIVEYIQLHRKVVDFTFAPDEVIFQSIILNSDKNYKVINNNLRFTLWSNDEEVGSSDILTEQHYQSLINSDAFFARKIEPARSEKLIKMINNYIQTT